MVNLRRKQYCILNRQVTEEEYGRLLPGIIEYMRKTGEWGEFLPLAHSSIPYNHSLAQRYFPLSREEVRAQGLHWYDEPPSSIESAIRAEDLPDSLPPLDEALVVRSVRSSHPFKITPQEIKRYRKLHVPLPRETYDERMEERARMLGGLRLYERTCAKCGKPIQTTYSPDRPEIVYCETCYPQAVY